MATSAITAGDTLPIHATAVRSPYIEQPVVDGPVGLVIVRAGDRRNATTISFFSEVAHHPTSMWISVARDSYTKTLLEESGKFSFIVLGRNQAEIAMRCGTASGRTTDKFGALDLYEQDGFFFLHGAISSTACQIQAMRPLGDHVLFIANMLHGTVERGRKRIENLLVSHLRQGVPE